MATTSLPTGGYAERERQIAAFAVAQHDVVTRQQLLELGLGPGAVKSRVDTGRLYPIHAGVYGVGRPSLSTLGHRMAAVLACGPTAVLSHKSAAEHWGLLVTAQAKADVTVPGTSRAQRPKIRVHRARTLAPDEVTILDGIPVTSLARTLLDLAGSLTRDRLLRAVEQADRIQKLDCRAVMVVLDRHPRHHGRAKLRRIMATYAGPPDVRSVLERDFHAFVITSDLPLPLLNVDVAGVTVDAHWPQWRLVVELDSRGYHMDTAAFENDRIRDAKLMRAGQRVLRITHRRLTGRPGDVLDDILALAADAEPALGHTTAPAADAEPTPGHTTARAAATPRPASAAATPPRARRRPPA